jgi:hypothetical protein
MRTLSKVVLTLCALALVAGPAAAQRPQGGGGRGGGFGGFGGFGPGGQQGIGGLLQLLQNKSVQQELKLDEDEVAKIPDAVMAALEKSLKPEQYKRLKQIQIQQQGPRAFLDAKVQKELKITNDQKEQLQTVMRDAMEGMRDLFQGGGGGDFREKMNKYNKDTVKKMTSVLNADQKKQWRDMVGEPFEVKFDRPTGRRQDR